MAQDQNLLNIICGNKTTPDGILAAAHVAANQAPNVFLHDTIQPKKTLEKKAKKKNIYI